MGDGPNQVNSIRIETWRATNRESSGSVRRKRRRGCKTDTCALNKLRPLREYGPCDFKLDSLDREHSTGALCSLHSLVSTLALSSALPNKHHEDIHSPN